MKPFKYNKTCCDWAIFYVCDTDFSVYSYSPELTIYKKGCFRERMDKVVLMITNIMKQLKDIDRTKFIYFDTIKEAEDYVKSNYLKGGLKQNDN